MASVALQIASFEKILQAPALASQVRCVGLIRHIRKTEGSSNVAQIRGAARQARTQIDLIDIVDKTTKVSLVVFGDAFRQRLDAYPDRFARGNFVQLTNVKVREFKDKKFFEISIDGEIKQFLPPKQGVLAANANGMLKGEVEEEDPEEVLEVQLVENKPQQQQQQPKTLPTAATRKFLNMVTSFEELLSVDKKQRKKIAGVLYGYVQLTGKTSGKPYYVVELKAVDGYSVGFSIFDMSGNPNVKSNAEFEKFAEWIKAGALKIGTPMLLENVTVEQEVNTYNNNPNVKLSWPICSIIPPSENDVKHHKDLPALFQYSEQVQTKYAKDECVDVTPSYQRLTQFYVKQGGVGSFNEGALEFLPIGSLYRTAFAADSKNKYWAIGHVSSFVAGDMEAYDGEYITQRNKNMDSPFYNVHCKECGWKCRPLPDSIDDEFTCSNVNHHSDPIIKRDQIKPVANMFLSIEDSTGRMSINVGREVAETLLGTTAQEIYNCDQACGDGTEAEQVYVALQKAQLNWFLFKIELTENANNSMYPTNYKIVAARPLAGEFSNLPNLMQ